MNIGYLLLFRKPTINNTKIPGILDLAELNNFNLSSVRTAEAQTQISCCRLVLLGEVRKDRK